MIIKNIFEEHGFDNVVSYSGKDLSLDLIKRCLNLDKVFYKKDFYWDTFNIEKVLLQRNELCFVFIDSISQNIVGYSYWLPIKTEILEEFKQNKKALLEIKPEYCTDFKQPKVNLFLGGEAFVPGYDLLNLHKAIEDIFQIHILHLAENNVLIDTICFDAVCAYDKDYLVPLTGLRNKSEKENCDFYYDTYSPNRVYKESIYAKELKKYYKE